MPKVRKEIPELEKLVQVGRKKFVRYEEGAQLYSISIIAYPETKAESRLINEYIADSSTKFKRVIQPA